jgi:hypothetical protein
MEIARILRGVPSPEEPGNFRTSFVAKSRILQDEASIFAYAESSTSRLQLLLPFSKDWREVCGGRKL